MNSANNPLVSVITPFHNTADYLEECIQSVLAQTYQSWEYILLDNCSTDASHEIAARYAQQDARIKLIRANDLVTQIPNYNRALQHISAESRYCKIVQADDWIFPNCLEEMVRVASLDPNVGVIGSYSIYEDTLGHVGLPFSKHPVFSGHDAIRRLLLTDDGFIGSPTCVMFRSDLVRGRDPFYLQEYDSFEDLEACLALLLHSDFAFAFQALTFNRRSNYGFWARMLQYGPITLHLFLLTRRFGPEVMSPVEFELRYKTVEKHYYSLLASAILTGKGKEFWDFHRPHLDVAGIKISKSKLAAAIFGALIDAAKHPITTTRKVLGKAG